MKTRIAKVGNRLVISIPISLANGAKLKAGELVEVTAAGDRLIVNRADHHPQTLDDLLAGVTKDNRPTEWNTGPHVGRESR